MFDFLPSAVLLKLYSRELFEFISEVSIIVKKRKKEGMLKKFLNRRGCVDMFMASFSDS